MTMTTDNELILPPSMWTPAGEISHPTIQPIEPETAQKLEPKERSQLLPTPTGWKILCMCPDVSDKFETSEVGIVKADTFMRQEEIATTVLFVMKVGPDAYKDTTKFPSGAWCKEGDFVLVRTYAGTRFKIHGKEFRLLNDDQIDAVVDDPRGVTRA